MLVYNQYNFYYKWSDQDIDSLQFYKRNGGSDAEIDFIKVYGVYKQNMFIPYYQIAYRGFKGCYTSIPRYIQTRSIIAYFPAMFFDYMYNLNCPKENINNISEEVLARCLNKDNKQIRLPAKSSNLLIILVESLESWAIADIEGFKIMPNLSNFIETHESLLFASKIVSQVKHGVSGDGQMILNTGLLPISNGSACNDYGNNTFPNFAHFYYESMVIAPSLTWNQDVVTPQYGYKHLFIPETDNWLKIQDDTLLSVCNQYTTKTKAPYCVQTITISSHTPFNRISHSIPLEANIPQYMYDYIRMLHYTDSCLGNLLESMQSHDLLKNTTIIITGDHTIFKDQLLREFRPYALKYNLSMKNGKNYVPLIIYSPNISRKTLLEEEYYQMDIYPTIMHLIGCEDYYWKGFGVNLLDSVARHSRSISEQEAYELSDKLIRSNYFAKIDK